MKQTLPEKRSDLSATPARGRNPLRCGLSLIELLLATAIMAFMAVALGSMATAVYRGSEFSNSYGTAAQHARVVIGRINRTVANASANPTLPGAVVLDEDVEGWRFPDTLVVWMPENGEPDDIDAGPLLKELVIFCPNPDDPEELVEITSRSNSSTTRWPGNTVAGRAAIESLKASTNSKKTVLTDLMRSATVHEAEGSSSRAVRGCIRFESRLFPTESDLNTYQASSQNDSDWIAIPWSQSIFSLTSGTRQTWIRYEIQLSAGKNFAANSEGELPPLPFFGSASLYYQLSR